MTEQNNSGGPDIVEALGAVLGEKLEEQRKKAQPVPDVYKSGMRGNEKPPHLREKEKTVKPGDKGKGADKGKGKNKQGEEDEPADGRRTVTFRAKTRESASDKTARLEEENEQLRKQLKDKGRKKIVI